MSHYRWQLANSSVVLTWGMVQWCYDV